MATVGDEWMNVVEKGGEEMKTASEWAQEAWSREFPDGDGVEALIAEIQADAVATATARAEQAEAEQAEAEQAEAELAEAELAEAERQLRPAEVQRALLQRQLDQSERSRVEALNEYHHERELKSFAESERGRAWAKRDAAIARCERLVRACRKASSALAPFAEAAERVDLESGDASTLYLFDARVAIGEIGRALSEPAAGVEAPLPSVPWVNAGGPNECEHGFAAGMHCPQCARRGEWPDGRPPHSPIERNATEMAGPICDAKSPTALVCFRARGHAGDHISCSRTRIFGRWAATKPPLEPPPRLDPPPCPGPDCLACNGGACDKCGAGLRTRGPDEPRCEHDVIERHERPEPPLRLEPHGAMPAVGVEPSRPIGERRQTLREQVAEFHAAFGAPTRRTPEVPSDGRVRLRLRLVAEEFFELVESAIDDRELVRGIRSDMAAVINSSPVVVDLPEFTDALADLDYVIEGTRLEFGIDGAPIAAAVHAANMGKLEPDGKPITRADGKIVKPIGWTPPDIDGELRKQGWRTASPSAQKEGGDVP